MPSRFLAALCAAAILLIGCGSSSSNKAGSSPNASASTSGSSSSAGVTIQVTVKGGRVDGGVQTKDMPLSSEVALTVYSDVSDEVHVHGYDKKVDVTAGSYATVTFTADIPGQFEVELENAHLKILELRVS